VKLYPDPAMTCAAITAVPFQWPFDGLVLVPNGNSRGNRMIGRAMPIRHAISQLITCRPRKSMA
jgi:hypothetical protein